MACDISQRILSTINEHGPTDSIKLSALLKEDHQKIVGAVKSLQSLGNVIDVSQETIKEWKLTEEGKIVAEKGSHEARVYYAIPGDKGISQAEVMKEGPYAKVGFSKAMSSGWICIDKSSGSPLVKQKVPSIVDSVKENLCLILSNEADKVSDALKQDYKKRKLLEESIIKCYALKRGPEFSLSIVKAETDLNTDMILSGSWAGKEFKEYNFDAFGLPPSGGHLHPLLKVRSQFRQIFLEMGFSEMPTDKYVENSFWNFDALFQPQQHPARDAHDTFFLLDPQISTTSEMEYLRRVKNVHSKGGFGSKGYGYEWKLEEAQKNLLRTHTTAVSARMLYQLAQDGFKPVKYFSIDRVFRNETLDATHLAEFHQVEGVVADFNLTLGHLIGFMQEFFRKLGIDQLKFKPTYNPYTEPSMEVYCFHNGLNKWIEVGNSGVFRPEMLLPMGLPENVTVIAWGLSLERPTMIKYGIDNIRDLVGPRVNLQMVQDNPICRLDKTKSSTGDLMKSVLQQWDQIFKEVENLRKEVQDLKVGMGESGDSTGPGIDDLLINGSLNICIFADPVRPPYSLNILVNILRQQIPITTAVHVHSSMENIPDDLKNFFSCGEVLDKNVSGGISIRLVWKPVGLDPTMVITPTSSGPITGEVNIARLMCSFLKGDLGLNYRHPCSLNTLLIDHWLDLIHKDVIHGEKSDLASFEGRISCKLKEAQCVTGNEITIVDLCLWSALKNLQLEKKFIYQYPKWYEKISQYC
ncbi:phenylalanine--tRNA ligase alpha subunit [Ischnura elegans]|uniref:phenylalanine--tRNA ligase alpha subunit n=1 Tax=Ischnura elegans TaxID=197161 RepID=UPI001ED88B70|nr:phenylalanine--tRNA ligase alpha subunit [Ischnura elegans]